MHHGCGNKTSFFYYCYFVALLEGFVVVLETESLGAHNYEMVGLVDSKENSTSVIVDTLMVAEVVENFGALCG